MSALQPIYNLPIQYKQGGSITVASGTTLSISSCLVRANADELDINIGDYFGDQDSTTLNAALNGLNGLDTGSLAASTVYAVYAIADQAGYNQPGFLLSTSLTAPVMPNGIYGSNYNSFVRIGWAVTGGASTFLTLKQSGQGSVVEYSYDLPVQVLNAGASAVQAAVDLSAAVPAVEGMQVKLGCSLNPAAASRTAKICYSGGTIASSQNVMTGQVAAVLLTQVLELPVALISGDPKVDYIMSNADSNLTMYVNGFTDLLL